FTSTAVGAAIFSATADRPQALFEWFPQALLFGFWQSHLGKKRTQAKLPRSWVSEVVGYEPATTGTRVLGLKGDPMNLSIEEPVQWNEDDLLGDEWSPVDGGSKSTEKGKKRDRLSNLGHGQVPVSENEAAPAAISFAHVAQRATVSFASLRRIHTGDAEASAAGRALLVALGLAA